MASKFSRIKDADKAKADLITAVTSGETKSPGRPRSTEEETKKFNANIPLSLYDAFKAKATENGHTMTWLIMDFMQKYIEEDK